MNAIEAARNAVKASLADLGIPVHAYSGQVASGATAVVVWGSPLWETRTKSRAVIGLRVHILTPSTSGEAVLDDLISRAIPLLQNAGIRVDSVTQPRSDAESTTNIAEIDVYVSVEGT